MKNSGLLSLPLFLLSACAGPGGYDPGETFSIVADGSAASVGHLSIGVGGSGATELPVASMSAAVAWDSATGGRIESLVIPLGDVAIGPEHFPPNGLRLRDVTLSLPGPAHGSSHRQPTDQRSP